MESYLIIIMEYCHARLPEAHIHTYYFSLSIRPILWLTSAVIIGELSNRHITKIIKMEEELEVADNREQVLSSSYQQLNQLKEGLEIRVAGQLKTVISTYQAARAIEKLDPALVLFGVSEMVGAMMGPKKFSLFTLSANGLQAGIQKGWETNEPLGRIFSTNSVIYTEIVAHKRILCISNSEDEDILDGEGIIAGPILSEDKEQVLGMLKIEKMGFMELSLNTVENFKVLCQWIGAVYTNAQRFQRAESNNMVAMDGNLLSHAYFTRQTNFLIKLAQRSKFDVSMVVITLDNHRDLSTRLKSEFTDTLSETIHSSLRDTDLAFDHKDKQWEFAVVLPFTGLEGANIVASNLKQALDHHSPNNLQSAKYSTKTQFLHNNHGKS